MYVLTIKRMTQYTHYPLHCVDPPPKPNNRACHKTKGGITCPQLEANHRHESKQKKRGKL